jgi:cytoskeletal protein RodZ
MAENQVNEAPVQDEFENPPAGPIGLHRGQRSWIVRLLPFLITLLVACVLAAGVWLWMSGKGREIFTGSSSSTSQTATSSQKDDSDSSADSKSADSDTTTNSDSTSDSAVAGDATESSDDATSGDANADNSAATATPESTVDTSKSVIIYNGLATRISGFAAGKASTLKTAGYTSVSAKNPTGSKPASNVVWYKTAADEATAKDVAVKLGIANVAQATSITTDVAVMYVSK